MRDAAQSFGAFAGEYARRRPHYPPALFAWLAEQSPAQGHVWDAATGNGQAAVALAAHFAQVTASDHSAEQIAAAAVHPRVSYRAEPAERCALPDASCDAVTVAQALHWFDLAQFFATVRRVLRPGGLFCAWGYSFAQVTPAVDDVVARGLLTPIAPFWAPQNRLLWDGYRSVALPLTRLSTPRLAIELDWRCDAYLAYLATWSATHRARQTLGDGWWQTFADELGAVWPQPDAVLRVTMPLAVLAGRNEG